MGGIFNNLYGPSYFPIEKGDAIHVGRASVPCGLGKSGESQFKGEFIMSNDNPHKLGPNFRWAMGDVDGDGTVDVVLINHQYNKDKSTTDAKDISVYIADDAIDSVGREISGLDDYYGLRCVGAGGKLTYQFVSRKNLGVMFGQAQETYVTIKKNQNEIKERFFKSTEYETFNCRKHYYNVKSKGENRGVYIHVSDHYEQERNPALMALTKSDKNSSLDMSENYLCGARFCFQAENEARSLRRSMKGSYDGVIYDFVARVEQEESQLICRKMKISNILRNSFWIPD